MILPWTVISYIFHMWRTLYANLIGRIAFFTGENIAHIEFYLQGILPKILAIYTNEFAFSATKLVSTLKAKMCGKNWSNTLICVQTKISERLRWPRMIASYYLLSHEIWLQLRHAITELATENTPGQNQKKAPPWLYHLHLGMTSMLALRQQRTRSFLIT